MAYVVGGGEGVKKRRFDYLEGESPSIKMAGNCVSRVVSLFLSLHTTFFLRFLVSFSLTTCPMKSVFASMAKCLKWGTQLLFSRFEAWFATALSRWYFSGNFALSLNLHTIVLLMNQKCKNHINTREFSRDVHRVRPISRLNPSLCFSWEVTHPMLLSRTCFSQSSLHVLKPSQSLLTEHTELSINQEVHIWFGFYQLLWFIYI